MDKELEFANLIKQFELLQENYNQLNKKYQELLNASNRISVYPVINHLSSQFIH